MSNSNSIRKDIMSLSTEELGTQEKWANIEQELAIKCSKLFEPTNEELKNKLIDDLYKIKEFLGSNGLKKLDFLDDEIRRYSNTKQISLYEEEVDVVPKKVIQQYARVSHTKEGVIGIQKDFSYDQIRKLTNGVFRETGLVKFYISCEKKISGKVVAEMYEHPQSIAIATLIHSKKREEDGDSEIKRIILFGDNFNSKSYVKIKEIKIPLYVYKFISDENKEMFIFSIEKLHVGDYIITGMETECDDYKMLTASSKLATKLPYFFTQSAKSRITKFGSSDKLLKMLNDQNVGYDTLFNYLFAIKVKNKNIQLKYLKWFKKLIWAWLLHKPKGLRQTYPMHLYIAGPRATGKSMIIETIHEKVRETSDIFSGVSSTMKKLVPSFKYMPMQHGYLAESNRFAFCDEFLRCIVNGKNSGGGADRDESVGMMNDLLEHKKRVVGSGVSSGTAVMTARTLSVSNPVRGTNNMIDLLHTLDESFLSRWLIYYQGEEDIDLVRSSDDSDLEILKYSMDDHDLVSIIDYLHQIDAKYDKKKIMKIYHNVRPMLNHVLLEHYDSRQDHHIECLMDGVVKTRCLMEKDMSFEANNEDYRTLELIWNQIMKSWINTYDIRKLDVSHRIYYMSESCQYLFNKITDQKISLNKEEIFELVKSELNSKECKKSLITLIQNELITDDGEMIRPYWMK
jgi:hypothetical protein